MAKSFKKLISEVAEPKSAGERAFVDQHVVQRFDAQPSGQDHIFNGSTAPKKRLADFMPGQDAAAYDAAYKTSDGDDSIVDMPEEAEDPDSAELTEDPGEEKPMMMGQLRAMAHNLQGIARYIATTADPEEWFQNKLAGVAKEMQTLYGYATAETMSMGMNEETELTEASCGCGPDCKHCGGDHASAEVGQECGCCGNMIKEEVNEGILGAIGGAALAHSAGAGIVGKVVGGAVGSAVQDRIAGKGKKKKEETVDGRRLSFKEKAELDEVHDPKHVKMAVGIASDKRYAGGNMTGAVKQIDKIKKGLSNHPQVRAVLRKQNEELINKLDEAKLDELTAAEKKLVNQMYDKKGNLTPLGKQVMNHGKKPGDKGYVESIEEAKLDEAAPKISKGKAKGSISATGLRGKGMKKFDVNVSVVNGKFEFKITDESGKFQTVNMKKAASMLESVEDLQELDANTQKKFVTGAKNMKAYANKNGGVDKKDFLAIAKSMETIARINILQAGQELARLNRMVDGLDTDVRERVYAELKKVGLVESLEEAKKPAPKKKLTVKQMRQALDSQDERGKTKKKVTLKKAPWESTELEEKFTIKTSILSLDSGEKVKVSRDDAKLLTQFFADLNPRNSKEMRKILVKDKDGYNEILGFAREAL
jgi:hypothetical protein